MVFALNLQRVLGLFVSIHIAPVLERCSAQIAVVGDIAVGTLEVHLETLLYKSHATLLCTSHHNTHWNTGDDIRNL